MQRKSNWQIHVEDIEELLKESYDKLKITARFLQKQKGYYNEDEVQDLTNTHIGYVDLALDTKQKEIMQV